MSKARTDPAVLALFGVALTLCSFMSVRASAPMSKTQPGFYRMMLGDFEVTALNDGVVN
ncbi:MAG: hypothetical protein QOI59_6001 [Gammaproteobacteria bacterium]|nr:hypothetical protein [Gammaproteobacteria bacterium]